MIGKRFLSSIENKEGAHETSSDPSMTRNEEIVDLFIFDDEEIDCHSFRSAKKIKLKLVRNIFLLKKM